MENIRPEDRPKLFVLTALVVVVFGFVFMQIMKATGGGGSPAPAAAESTIVAGTPTTVASNDTPAPKQDLIELPTIFAASTLDPFQKVLPEKKPESISDRMMRPTPTTPRSSARPSGIAPYFVPMEGRLDTPMPAPGGEPIIEDARPKLVLKGLVFGPRAVAVIASGDENYVVHEGDMIPDGFVVKAIDDNGVTVSYGKERIRIPLGPS